MERTGSPGGLHYHCIVPDGVFARAEDGSLVFHRVSPTRADVEELVERIALRCERWLEARLEDDIPDEEEAQATLVAASAAGKVVSGEHAGRSVRRIRGEAVDARAGNGSSALGYGLHAGTFVAAHDRVGLQHLARYRGPWWWCKDDGCDTGDKGRSLCVLSGHFADGTGNSDTFGPFTPSRIVWLDQQ